MKVFLRTYKLSCMRAVFVFLLCILTSSVLKAQSKSAKKCFDGIAKYYVKVNAMQFPDSGEAFHFKYDIKYILNNEKKTVQVNNVDLKLSNTHIDYKTKETEMYQDPNYLIVVVHPGESIIISESTLDYYKSVNRKLLAHRKDSLLRTSKISDYTEYTAKDNSLIGKLTLINDEYKDLLEKTIYHYSYKEKRVIETETIYRNTSVLKEIVKYDIEEYSYKSMMNQPALSKVFDINMNLLSKYRGYAVVNNMDN